MNVTSGSQEALKVAIASRGPVSVAIDAGHKSLSFYSNGQFLASQDAQEVMLFTDSLTDWTLALT